MEANEKEPIVERHWPIAYGIQHGARALAMPAPKSLTIKGMTIGEAGIMQQDEEMKTLTTNPQL